MNDRFPYDFDDLQGKNTYHGNYLNNMNPEATTDEKIYTLKQLFDEAPSSDDSFPLNNESTLTHITDTDDPLDQTSEISGVNLEELKAIQAELKKAKEEESFTDTNSLENAGDSQSKGKSLVKATKQGRAFSNGSMTKTFLDCTILGFVTAAMGFGWLINIINHI